MQPPADAIVLGISGLRDVRDQQAVEAAIRYCDPGATLWTDWPNGRIAIRSRAPVAALMAAAQGPGFSVTELPRVLNGRGTGGGVVARMLFYALLAGVLGVAAGVAIGLANAAFNPECARPGSSGGCAIGVGIFGFLLGAIGTAGGLVAGLVHGLARLRR